MLLRHVKEPRTVRVLPGIRLALLPSDPQEIHIREQAVPPDAAVPTTAVITHPIEAAEGTDAFGKEL